MDRELRDKIYRLKLRMLNDRLSTNTAKEDVEDQYAEPVRETTFNNDLKIKQLDLELQDTKKKYERLKSKLKEEELKRNIKLDLSRENSTNGSKSTDTMSKLMEMMMLQQIQIQGMVTSQTLVANQRAMPQEDQNRQLRIQESRPTEEAIPKIPTFLVNSKTDSKVSQPYPGNEVHKSLRRIGLAALFCAIIDCDVEERSIALTDKFLFEIKVKEIIQSIEKFFTSPTGQIYSILNKLAGTEAPNLKVLLSRSGTNEELSLAETEMNTTLQGIITSITEFMPRYGTLGCECKSILSEFLHDKQTFPDRYFFGREFDLLQVDEGNTTHQVGFPESQVLLIGVVIMRALVMRGLMRPVECKLCPNVTVIGKENLKILASLLTAIYISILGDFITQRHPNDQRNKSNTKVTFVEMEGFLMSEEESQALVKIVKKTIDAAKVALVKWSETYVMKLKPM